MISACLIIPGVGIMVHSDTQLQTEVANEKFREGIRWSRLA